MSKKINIIAVGGVTKILAKFNKNQNLFAIETNQKTLDALPDHITKFCFGGDGAGGDTEFAKSLFDPSQIESIFDCDLLIIIAGLGGGTGSGIAPEVAKIAKDKQILSKLILFSPLNREGAKQNSSKSLENFQSLNLPITLIDNQAILENLPNNLTIADFYNIADYGAIETIKTLENVLSSQNIDYKDIQKSFVDGYTYCNTVKGKDFDTAFDNLQKTTLIDPNTLANSKNFLLSIKSNNMSIKEFDTIGEFTNFIKSKTQANFKFSFDQTDKDFEISIFITGISDKVDFDPDYSQIQIDKIDQNKKDYISQVRSESAKKSNQS